MGVPQRGCVQCGQSMEPDARFCNSCGQAVPAPDSYAPTGTMVTAGRDDPGRPGPPAPGSGWPFQDAYQPTQFAERPHEPTQMAQPQLAQPQPAPSAPPQPDQFLPTQAAPELRPRPFTPQASPNPPAGYQPAPAGYHPAPPAGYHPAPPAAYQPAPPSDYHPPSPSEFQPMPGELPPVGDYPSSPNDPDFSSWFQDRSSRPADPAGAGQAFPDPRFPDPRFAGPPGGPPPGSGRPGRSRRTRLLLTVVVAAVLAAVVAFLLLRHSGSGSASAGATQSASAPASSASASAGSGSEEQAAKQLAGLLSQSGRDKSSITTAYDDVNDCGPQLAQDAQTFSTAASSRQQLLTQLGTMPGRSALPAGMLATLTTAWQASITADQDYGKWAQDEASGACKKNDHADANFQAANTPDNRATAQKVVFLRQWNPIASRYGLPTYSWYQI